MQTAIKSLRPFIGSIDFEVSRNFYRDFGFEEVSLGPMMSVFKLHHIAFYLQKAYVKDWLDNTMLFLEVNDVIEWRARLLSLDLPAKYSGVRVSNIREEEWGREFFVHDPAGVLWHIGEFRE